MEKYFDRLLELTKLRLRKMHYNSNCGHLVGNFSCIDRLGLGKLNSDASSKSAM